MRLSGLPLKPGRWPRAKTRWGRLGEEENWGGGKVRAADVALGVTGVHVGLQTWDGEDPLKRMCRGRGELTAKFAFSIFRGQRIEEASRQRD